MLVVNDAPLMPEQDRDNPDLAAFAEAMRLAATQSREMTGRWPDEMWIGVEVANRVKLRYVVKPNPTSGRRARFYGTCHGIAIWGDLLVPGAEIEPGSPRTN